MYKITEEKCRENIHGVCEGCGGPLEPIETVDNSRNPTFWVGCMECQCFRCGVDKMYYDIAVRLKEDFYLSDMELASVSRLVVRIHHLIKEYEGVTDVRD